MTSALCEIAAAHKLGFRRFRDFKRALREGQIPRPDHVLVDGPRWLETRLDSWLARELGQGSVDDEERRLIERITHGAAPGAKRAA